MTATSPIERVVLTHVQVPLKQPLRTSEGEFTVKDAILVTLETASEVAAGESSPLAGDLGVTAGTPEQCWKLLSEAIAPSLLGFSFSTTEEIGAIASGWPGGGPAAAGAETALWDLLGQSHRVTVAQLLGAIDEQIRLGVQSGLGLGSFPSIVELLRSIETHLVEGFRRVRIRISPGSDVEVVRAVRQHFGDIPLMVDANGAYSSRDIDVLRALDEFDLLMIEQPMKPGDIEGMIALQGQISTPICIDESAGTMEQTTEAIRLGACRIVNLKIQRVGGLGPARAIHDLCFQHGIACWVGSTPELGLGQSFGLHLATLANCKYPTGVQPSARWFVDDCIAPALELSSPGLFSIPQRPGVGYQVDQQKLRRYQVRQAEFTSRTTG
ncbi:o-succinylbenzoate synthase [Aquisphaera giovannonii]|uniref:o-succinylbenzoate synthase n=1 Tax=Aquisphaera giovannonii TaxID=406548 RepID=A0A5B9VZ95_9BACT|nr:o-succinylbenzoate synthase [Aquisphaera giovannonii]QEH33643.1 o-succinylbenzoate synthase [Aquisphaera giovannonii]